ncbi:MAG: hypothetical protein ACR2JW_10595 [Thermomicrobiales bacterium]
MHRVRPARILTVAIALVALMTVVFVVAVSAATPAPPLVAQAATVAPTGTVAGSADASPAALSTAPASSVVAGTASAPSPAALATADAASVVPSPSIPPPIPSVVDTGGGIDRGALVETIIGVGAAIVVVGLGAWGLIRLIATA